MARKKIPIDELKYFRERFGLDLSDDDIEQLNFYKPKKDSVEIKYLMKNREN